MSARPPYVVDPAIDPLTAEDLADLAASDEPCVSLLMPTERSGPATRAGGDRLRRLVSLAADRGDDVRRVQLDSVERLAADETFWQHQGEGLAVFVRPSGLRSFRLPVPVTEQVALEVPRLRPLVPAVAAKDPLLVVALSTAQVRLFEATRWTMSELPLGTLPGSLEDLKSDRDLQKSLQWSVQGGGEQNVHGHGGDASARRVLTQRFFRVVARGLADRFGAGSPPLVLACVPENRALFESVGGHPRLVDELVPGNADRTPPWRLHEQAWEVASHHVDEGEGSVAQEMERWTALAGTGRLVHTVGAVLAATEEGRVEMLFVAPEPLGPTTGPQVVHDPVDLAIGSTLRQGGLVRALPDDVPALGSDQGVTAALRW